MPCPIRGRHVPSASGQYLFVLGGVGDGPEDVTMAAVTKAFGTGDRAPCAACASEQA